MSESFPAGVEAVFQELRDLLKAAVSARGDSSLSVQDVLSLAILAHAIMGSRVGPGGLKPFAEGAQNYAHESQGLRDALVNAVMEVSTHACLYAISLFHHWLY